MSYSVDKTEQLAEGGRKGYAALVASLRAQGVPTKQHNDGAKKSAKKTAAKKVSANKTAAKKTTKSSAKKTTTKKS